MNRDRRTKMERLRYGKKAELLWEMYLRHIGYEPSSVDLRIQVKSEQVELTDGRYSQVPVLRFRNTGHCIIVPDLEVDVDIEAVEGGARYSLGNTKQYHEVKRKADVTYRDSANKKDPATGLDLVYWRSYIRYRDTLAPVDADGSFVRLVFFHDNMTSRSKDGEIFYSHDIRSPLTRFFFKTMYRNGRKITMVLSEVESLVKHHMSISQMCDLLSVSYESYKDPEKELECLI